MKPLNVKRITVYGTALATGFAAWIGTMGQSQATPASLSFYPSSDIYERGNIHYDVDVYGRGVRADSSVTHGLTYGFGSGSNGFLGRNEVGFDYVLSLGGTSPSNLGINTGKRLLFNFKSQLYNNERNGTRVVAGAWGLGNRAIFAPNVGYVLAAKTFEWGRVHVGVAHSFSADATVVTPTGNAYRTNLHLGYDRYLTPKLQFAVDYYSGKSSYSGVQPMVYYYVSDKADFGVGAMRYNDRSVTPSRYQLYVCFDYNFGGDGSNSASTPAVASPTAAPTVTPATP